MLPLRFVAPFVSAAVSRRGISRLPMKILDNIAFFADSTYDLLSLALTYQGVCSAVSPRHFSYCDIKAKVSLIKVRHHLGLIIHRGPDVIALRAENRREIACYIRHLTTQLVLVEVWSPCLARFRLSRRLKLVYLHCILINSRGCGGGGL